MRVQKPLEAARSTLDFTDANRNITAIRVVATIYAHTTSNPTQITTDPRVAHRVVVSHTGSTTTEQSLSMSESLKNLAVSVIPSATERR